MAGNIWGEGQRGGIFGTRVDPALLRELEKRAEAKRRMAQGLESAAAVEQPSTIGSRAKEWWDKSTFFKPAWEELTGAATLPGDVYAGRQATMSADPRTGEMHTAPELMDRAGALAGSMTLGAGAIPAEANALRMGIKAYHGSPHDFERFDASKIGTGEGAQAYGHGLYFAEREGVAREYRDALKWRGSDWDDPQTIAANVLESRTVKGDRAQAVKELENARAAQLRTWPNRPNEPLEKAIELLRSDEPITVSSANKGRMYEVDIAAEPEQFLDWDKPLSEQSPQVREFGQSLLPKDATGADLAKLLGESTGRAREAGIPGIRYLDQGSRGTGTGTSNYVVFDDKLISILRKYGLPISTAGLAALSQLHPEEAKAAQKKDRK